MSSNILPKDIDLNNKHININNKCDVINFEEELIRILDFGFERIGNRFLQLRYRDKDEVFNEIGYCFKGFANRMKTIKDDLTK